MCEFCEKVVYQNFAGKQFFTPMHSSFGKDNLCLAIDNWGRYVIHYEDIHKTMSDVISAPINFCPICGRKLTEEE